MIEKTAYCLGCKKMQPIVDTRIERIPKTNMPVIKGKCEVCNRNLVKILPKDTPVPNEEEPYFEPPIEPAGDSLEEEQIEKFKKDVKDNKILKKNGINIIDEKKEIPIKKTYYDLFKYLLIILSVGLLVFAYLVYSGYLNDEIDLVCGNSTCENSCPVCPSCSCSESCGDCNCDCPSFPSDLNINVTGG